ncbi:MAG: bifunctional diaminohydroxyphosphoribosylaminopyrimidine deaminase/5-amino-6-(5-phosphoribosylamino)uracil reductase RibD [Actinomycetaceae bacterium]|nr:bifunctional diaminohydroxyphosphoribosylaminopyrimidine deaminase/5-amino-6-(5-phosphoribosylamino)uracil reductase RibD [Arcanobacterium sp.]MDD7505067.1 bifunctional diaminohydroxyphosphoribosylaminopyrimidine deaminase/5-amino-6-(5-phosphoribosylamino)uracil reductase RibD [Actinomycetaceae bacterium]MDY6143758.1 bifunctional diaminohydroxyphosphoribosylaminopyrimidine deaminase/5-amino-6-(5-phosphoribosylamino)uracil reductase RibD [Arcanobacterium sp.]
MTSDSVRLSLDAALQRALDLAACGVPYGGNPRVGCVLLDDAGLLLAEGYHRGRGTAHAEAAALAELSQQDPQVRARLHTAVVTLEPCNHTGVTPPCAQALIDAGVQRVIYADADINPSAAGGAETLRRAGVEVLSTQEASIGTATLQAVHDFNEIWFTAMRRGRPWVIAKTAQSLDGYVAAIDGTSKWITSQVARELGHRIRALSDAVIIGTGTLLADHPSLAARPSCDGAASNLALPFDASQGAGSHQPLRVIAGERENPWPEEYRDALHWKSHDLEGLLQHLFDAHARVVLIEGGPRLVAAALGAGLTDEHLIISAPIIIGQGNSSIPLPVQTLADSYRPQRVQYGQLCADSRGQKDSLTQLLWHSQRPVGLLNTTRVLTGLLSDSCGATGDGRKEPRGHG